MDLPQPPKDTDLRNIIDKLAQFVARNGPEFEQMTKSKQKNNPKFSFLYGGEHFNYYQYKVAAEQASERSLPPCRTRQPPRPDAGGDCAAVLKQAGRRDTAFPPPVAQYGALGPVLSNPEPPPVSPARPGSSRWPPRSVGGARNPPTEGPPNPNAAAFTVAALEALTAQQATLREQIKQSEANLSAQHSVLIQQQQTQMEDTVANAQNESMHRLATENNIDLAEFDGILQPIIDSCTKDSISAGKGWILNHATTREIGMLLSQYLLKKVTTPGSLFVQKLHIIYLVNDVLHHCARKNAEDLKKSLESVVVPMFCNASIAITEEQETKLNKLLKLWESKSNYFEQSIIEKMKDPTNSYQEYSAGLISQYANLITPLTQQTKAMLENYQKQHQAFVTHTMQQIQQLEMQKQIIEQQMNVSQLGSEQNNPIPTSHQNSLPPNVNFNIPPYNDQIFNIPTNTMPRNLIPPPYEPPSFPPSNQPIFSLNEPPQMPGNYGPQNGVPTNSNDDGIYDFEQSYNQNSNNNPIINTDECGNTLPSINLSQPPPGFFDAPLSPAFQNGLPDLSKPPPGFSAPAPTTPEICPDDLQPSVPYYELPAGLMVPLIMLEDSEYKPLDPDEIKLPPPAPPSERLLAAVKAFYAAPHHTRPQDSEGWEKLGLYEYYKAKNSARKQKEDDISSGIREKSKSPSPIQLDHFPIRSLPTRRYRSKSRSLSRERERSRSKTPPIRKSVSPDRDSDRGSRRVNRKGRRSPTNSSPSHSPNRQYRRASPESDEHAASDNFHPSRSDKINRSPSNSIDSNNGIPLSELDSTNKGHQMLRKMGWTQGAGLGATGQGITQPVSASSKDKDSARDINMSDPYENFRKNKGAAFITRMKERALERSS